MISLIIYTEAVRSSTLGRAFPETSSVWVMQTQRRAEIWKCIEWRKLLFLRYQLRT